MADDRYRQDYPHQHIRPEENRSRPSLHHQPRSGDAPQHASDAHAPRATMAASVTLPSIHDPRAAAYGAHPPPPSRGYSSNDGRYASPNAVNGYPPPHGQQPPGYLPPLQSRGDSRGPGYGPPDPRAGYYEDRRPQYHEQYPSESYYYGGGHPPQGHPPNGYGRDYRGPPPGYAQEYVQAGPSNGPPGLAQAAPRQRTSIACRYCRKRKIRCSGYQSAPGGKCQNCARMNQECIFQPVSSSSSTAFIPVSALPNGVPPGTQLFGAYGQPLAPNSVPAPHSYPHGAGHPPSNYYGPMQSPTESYSSYGDSRDPRDPRDPRGEENAQMAGRRRRRTSEEQDDGYRLPPPRAPIQDDDPRRRSPAEFSNHSSPSGLTYPPYHGARQSPRNTGAAQPAAGGSHSSSAPGGRSPGAQNGSSGASTPARQGASSSQSQSQQAASSSVMSLSNLVDKNDMDKTMINRLNRSKDS